MWVWDSCGREKLPVIGEIVTCLDVLGTVAQVPYIVTYRNILYTCIFNAHIWMYLYARVKRNQDRSADERGGHSGLTWAFNVGKLMQHRKLQRNMVTFPCAPR